MYTGGDHLREFFRWLLIAHLEGGEDFFVALSRGFERVDVFIEFGARSRGVPRRWHGGGFGDTDVLGAIGSKGAGASGAASGSVVAGLPATEAATFSDAFSSLGGSELRYGDVVDIHGVGILLGAKEGRGGLRASSSKGLNAHFLCVEGLGLFDPLVDRGRDGGHRENHSGESLIDSKGELINEGDVVSDACLASEVLEVGDILLEPVIGGSVGAANGFLDELGKVQAGSGSGIKGVECGFEVLGELLEGLLVVGDGGVNHLVVPHLSKGGSSSFTHLVEGRHDPVVVGGIEGGVEDKIGLHGLDPSGGIRGFFGKVSGKGRFELGGFGHGGLGGGLGLLWRWWWFPGWCCGCWA